MENRKEKQVLSGWEAPVEEGRIKERMEEGEYGEELYIYIFI
jgi:hypothetical protein